MYEDVMPAKAGIQSSSINLLVYKSRTGYNKNKALCQ